MSKLENTGLVGNSYYATYGLGALRATVRRLGWAIVLLILGILTFGSGGVLVVIGALIGLVAHATHSHH